MKKRRLLPFSLMPGSWGLTGTPYEEAKLNYYYDGYDLKEKLLELKLEGSELQYKLADLKLENKKIKKREWHKEYYAITKGLVLERYELFYEDSDLRAEDDADYLIEMLDSKKFHKLINEADYKKQLYDLEVKSLERDYKDSSENELKIKVLDLELKNNKISKNEHEKLTFTINEKPWFIIKETKNGDIDTSATGTIALDYNDVFIGDLRKKGYKGSTEDELCEDFLNEICKGVLKESGYDLENLKKEDEEAPPTSILEIKKNIDNNGKSLYS